VQYKLEIMVMSY